MIRFWKPKMDRPNIFRLIKEELLPYTQKILPAYQFDAKEVKKRLQKGATYVVSGTKGSAYGFVHVLIKERTVWIDMIAVDHKHQGKGWGKDLIRKAERYGKRKGCRKASLYVDITNIKAQKFYEKLGYKSIKYVPEIKCYLLSKNGL